MQGLVGVVLILMISWAISEDRSAIRWQPVLIGVALALVFALALLKISGVREAVLGLNTVVEAIQAATQAGTGLVFGYLGGGPLPFAENRPGSSFILAFQSLPVVLVMSALSALLFHWGVLQWVVRGFSWVLQRTMGIGGALGFATAANVFVGMVEAPLLVKPYLARMSRGELFAVMVVGMAGIAGTMMVLYASLLATIVPGALGHILVASVITAPAGLAISALMVPFGTEETTAGVFDETLRSGSTMDAITRGTTDGLTLFLNILAMLVVLVALVSLANAILAALPAVAGAPLTLQRIMGWLFAPLAWCLGLPWAEATLGGALLGSKTVLNEFVAYVDFARQADAFSAHSRLILTYALCGFANFGSLGIMIGGLGQMAPGRKTEIVQLGMKSILAGTFATCLCGAMIGVLA
ncbi:MAG: nucleoside:proton symporter [Gammaproteobacteria bacterium]|nr:nucleoside:proton symporter [Gammaproteobacteria bacterium]